MDETIKTHLDAIADHLKGTKKAFLFLVAKGHELHSAKNCEPHNAAALMVNYIEAVPDVEEAFTNYVMQLQNAENEEQSLKGKLSDKLDEKQIIIVDDMESENPFGAALNKAVEVGKSIKKLKE